MDCKDKISILKGSEKYRKYNSLFDVLHRIAHSSDEYHDLGYIMHQNTFSNYRSQLRFYYNFKKTVIKEIDEFCDSYGFYKINDTYFWGYAGCCCNNPNKILYSKRTIKSDSWYYTDIDSLFDVDTIQIRSIIKKTFVNKKGEKESYIDDRAASNKDLETAKRLGFNWEVLKSLEFISLACFEYSGSGSPLFQLSDGVKDVMRDWSRDKIIESENYYYVPYQTCDYFVLNGSSRGGCSDPSDYGYIKHKKDF